MRDSLSHNSTASLMHGRRAGAAFAVLISLVAPMLLVGCDVYEQGTLAYKRARLINECSGQYTNRCANMGISFNIAVLKSSSPEDWIPFTDAPDKAQMIELFGEDGWAMYVETVNTLSTAMIEHMEERRPGWISRYILADSQPINSGFPKLLFPEDFIPFKDKLKMMFLQRLKDANWKPTPKLAARLAAQGVTIPWGDTAEPGASTESPSPSLQVSPAAGSTSTEPAQATAAAPSGWQTIQQQIRSSPDSFVQDCINNYIESAQNLGGMSREEAASQPGIEESCKERLADLRNCMTLDAEGGERCYAAFSQNLE